MHPAIVERSTFKWRLYVYGAFLDERFFVVLNQRLEDQSAVIYLITTLRDFVSRLVLDLKIEFLPA